VRALGSILVVLLLLVGVALIGYARWAGVIGDADAALADGRLEQAAAGYAAAEARFDAIPVVRQAAAAEYNRAFANHLIALYRLKRYDEVIDLAQKAPLEAQPHFWSGTALFQKAVVEDKADTRLAWLSRAEDEFRKAIEAAPDDWDTKYDFELTTRLAAELQNQPNAPPKQLMQLLRPPTAGQKNPRKVG
jgi:tetratricopeptide (TPR) repeat protein